MTGQPVREMPTVTGLKWLPDGIPEMLLRREVEQYLRVSRATVLRLIEDGVLPAFLVGQSYRIRAQDLDEYMDTMRTGEI